MSAEKLQSLHVAQAARMERDDEEEDTGAPVDDNESASGFMSRLVFRYSHLDRQLKRHHITGIAFSGTIGIGLFISSGELIGIGGSLGCVLGFIIAGVVVISVMRCLAEMVSVRPIFSGLIDFPHTFVDKALGFAVGVIYCLAQCVSMATLTSAAARVAGNFDPDHPLSKKQTAGIIVGLLCTTLLSNVLGVRIYGNLERLFKWCKLIILIGLCVLMIVINVGVGGYPTEDKAGNYTHYSMPPTFDPAGFHNSTSNSSSAGIPGSGGQFLAVWTCITLAVFSEMGGDQVIVTAGEAKEPKKDLPAAARFMYLAPIGFYILCSFLVGLNINYKDQSLSHPYRTPSSKFTPSTSPFVIVMKHSSLDPGTVPNILNGCFLFSAYTAANTALYVASRTLFALARLYGTPFIKATIGRTNSGNTPLTAIVCCSCFGLLAFLGLADITFDQPVLSLSSFFTSSIACVYASECVAYLRFKQGLAKLEEYNQLCRDDDSYKRKHYRPHWQPLWAYLGLVGSVLIVLFSGWPAIYILDQRSHLTDGYLLKPSHLLAWDLVGAYSGPVIFVSLYLGYKFYHGTTLRTFQFYRYKYFMPQFDAKRDSKVAIREERPWTDWIGEIWSFIK